MMSIISRLWSPNVISARRNLLPATALLAVLIAGSVGHAATDTWSGISGTNWNNAGNWSALPVSGDSLVFDFAAVGTLTDDLMTTAGSAVGGITFTSIAPSYTINPNNSSVNGFTLTGPITNNGTSADHQRPNHYYRRADNYHDCRRREYHARREYQRFGRRSCLAGSGMVVLTGSNSFTGGIS